MTTLTRVRLRNRVGSRLKQARLDADLSQAETAEAVGLAQALISRAESGGRELKAIDLYLLARLYGRTLDSFFLDDPGSGQPFIDSAPPAGPHEPAEPPAPPGRVRRRRGDRPL